MNSELIERIDQAIAYFIRHQEAEGVALLRDCKAALNKYDAQQQGLIGSRARLQIEISIAESLIEDPNYEMSSMDCEYENSWHDKLKAALTQQQESEPANLTDGELLAAMRLTGVRQLMHAVPANVAVTALRDLLNALSTPRPAAQPAGDMGREEA